MANINYHRSGLGASFGEVLPSMVFGFPGLVSLTAAVAGYFLGPKKHRVAATLGGAAVGGVIGFFSWPYIPGAGSRDVHPVQGLGAVYLRPEGRPWPT